MQGSPDQGTGKGELPRLGHLPGRPSQSTDLARAAEDKDSSGAALHSNQAQLPDGWPGMPGGSRAGSPGGMSGRSYRQHSGEPAGP